MAGYDVIVIGAGHNGLVAATYLAKAGRRVLVLERRAVAGGQLAAERFGDGFEVDPLHASGALRPDVARDLGLAADAGGAAPPYVSLLPDGARLVLGIEPGDATVLDSIRRLSARDAGRWPEFVAFMQRAAQFLDAAYRTPMPRLPNVGGFAQGWPLAQLAWKLRRLGRQDMYRVLRIVSMSALELTEEWFKSDVVRAAVAALAIHGVTLGAMSAGTGYTLLHNWLNRGGVAHRQAAGAAGRLATNLAAAFTAAGGTLRTNAPVRRMLVERQRARGVELDGGEVIEARHVLSCADPRHTLLGLVGAPELPPDFVWATQSIKLRGSVAKVHCLTDGRHGLPTGTLVVAPGIRYLERAYDAAKYGELSEQPYLEVTTRANTVSIHVQFAPYTLKHGDWDGTRGELEKRALHALAQHAPALSASIKQVRSLTPRDLESTWGLSEGDFNHGQLTLDQLFFMRPIAGWSQHATPVDGLWLGGSGCHGGGGISGAAGRNAARALLAARAT
jgi:phytoene dehydrogenase-like protein